MMAGLLWLPDALRAADLPVRTVKGWERRSADGWEPADMHPAGVLVHATVTRRTSGPASGLGVVTHGRAGLPGPISQLHLSRDGIFTIVAAGVANHAGRGGRWGVTGNSEVIGIEAENDNGLERARYGAPEPWTPAQYTAYVRGVAAILAHMHQPADRVAAHKEWSSTGKSDPLFPMDTFRAQVGALLTAPPKATAGNPRPEHPAMGLGFGGPDGTDAQRWWVGKWFYRMRTYSPAFFARIVQDPAGAREVARLEIGPRTLYIVREMGRQTIGQRQQWQWDGKITAALWALYPAVK